MAVGLGNINACADGSRHRLLDQVDLTGAGLDTRVNDRALLDLRDTRGHTDHQTGFEEVGGSDFTDKFPQHPLGHIVVGNNALPQGADGNDVAGGTAQHILRLSPHL